MKRYACYSGSSNLYPYMVGAAKSLVEHTDVDRIFFLIEDNEFPEKLPNFIETIDVSGQEFFPPDGPNMKSVFTYLAMIRAALCYVLPDYVDKVLSLDVDTIVKADISDLWEIPMDGCYLAAAIEPGRSKDERLRFGLDKFDYINAGVTLYDLELLRDSGMADEVIDALNKGRFIWVEQDVFSYMCQGKIAELPPEYNACRFVKHFDKPKITHFAGFQPWHYFAEVKHYQEVSWRDVLKKRES